MMDSIERARERAVEFCALALALGSPAHLLLPLIRHERRSGGIVGARMQHRRDPLVNCRVRVRFYAHGGIILCTMRWNEELKEDDYTSGGPGTMR